jgi:integrase
MGKLTDKAIKAELPAGKPRKVFDGAGLYLLVTPAGGKLWRFKYRYRGKEGLLALGAYPDVSLKEARARAEAAGDSLAAGQDPGAERRVVKRLGRIVHTKRDKLRGSGHPTPRPGQTMCADTFEAVARDWHARNIPNWVTRHAEDVLASLQRGVFPVIGGIRLASVSPRMVLELIRVIEQASGGETARRVRQRISAVFVYAIAIGLAETDPAAVIKGAMAPVIRRRMPAVTTVADARAVLTAVEAMPAHPATKAAHRFLALTLVRPDNVHAARWDELGTRDGVPVWELAPERMKTREPHLVPLSRQAAAVVEAMRPLTGRGPFIFPNARFAHRPMSENALNYLLQRAGLTGRHVPHGWRATFATVMNETLPGDADVIERILAHAPRNKVRAAYNRASYFTRRGELLQAWADMLLVDAKDLDVLVHGPRRPLAAGAVVQVAA